MIQSIALVDSIAQLVHQKPCCEKPMTSTRFAGIATRTRAQLKRLSNKAATKAVKQESNVSFSFAGKRRQAKKSSDGNVDMEKKRSSTGTTKTSRSDSTNSKQQPQQQKPQPQQQRQQQQKPHRIVIRTERDAQRIHHNLRRASRAVNSAGTMYLSRNATYTSNCALKKRPELTPLRSEKLDFASPKIFTMPLVPCRRHLQEGATS